MGGAISRSLESVFPILVFERPARPFFLEKPEIGFDASRSAIEAAG
jgi:hypothetical protein